MTVALAGLVLAAFAAAQEGGQRVTTLAQVDLATVVQAPLQFRLLQVTVGVGEVASYRVSDGMVYQLAGARTVDVRMPAGSVVYEPYGLVHQWAKARDDATTVVLANISPEGVPAVVSGVPPDGDR